MEKVIPRWEWRTFGQSFGDAEENIKKFVRANFKASNEKYVLSKMSDENTKIRDELMDIKTLQQVNQDKLEQWYPAMKEGFPISKENLEILFRDFFKVPVPDFKRDTYTYTEFLDELISKCDLVLAVDVYKERSIYVINETIVEIAETKFNGIPNRTICVEHIDPELVMKTVCQLGLEGFENINYINAMKVAVGMGRNKPYE